MNPNSLNSGPPNQGPSPYAEPADMSAGYSPMPRRNWVAIVAMICGTTLLVCGGFIGLGFYAVERLADQIDAFDMDYDYDDDDESTEMAVQFAITDDPAIAQQVGTIESVQQDDDLTFSDDADSADYFYRVSGAAGEAVVVVEFDDDDERWFSSVTLLDGDSADSPQSALQSRPVPFDSKWSSTVFDALAQDESAAGNLGVGEIRWIVYDYEASSNDREADQTRLIFRVRGSDGSQDLWVEFNDDKYTDLATISKLDADGTVGDRIYTAPTVDGGED